VYWPWLYTSTYIETFYYIICNVYVLWNHKNINSQNPILTSMLHLVCWIGKWPRNILNFTVTRCSLVHTWIVSVIIINQNVDQWGSPWGSHVWCDQGWFFFSYLTDFSYFPPKIVFRNLLDTVRTGKKWQFLKGV